MNYKRLISAFLILLTLKTYSQDYKYTYYLDESLHKVSKRKAGIIGKGYFQGNSMVLDCFLKNNAGKIISATFTDSSLSLLNGMYRTYYIDMKIHSEGNYVNNNMDGIWKYWNADGFVTDSAIYRNGIKTAYAKYEYYFQKKISPILSSTSSKIDDYIFLYSFTDSLKNTLYQKEVSIVNGKSRMSFEANFIGNRGIYKEYDSISNMIVNDSVFDRKYEDASYPGGEEAWRTFLRQNVNPHVGVANKAPAGHYTIIIKFIVNQNGLLENFQVENDPGYGYVNEAIRVLKISKKWNPAVRYGRYYRAYRRQPFKFSVEY